jgi:hypothetical protein
MMQMNVKHKSIMIEINRVSFWVQHPPHLINLNIKKTPIAAHTLLLIGYGVEVVNEKMVEFWLVQNSHGKSWGHKGIGKFIMAINGPNGRPLISYGYAPVQIVYQLPDAHIKKAGEKRKRQHSCSSNYGSEPIVDGRVL